ncbi:MAG TPA: hypothetical protein VI583_09670 [Cyclobacteriaceae bacterium]|nr:hypothetical protein [Cyclobacteriaceae bacterium]
MYQSSGENSEAGISLFFNHRQALETNLAGKEIGVLNKKNIISPLEDQDNPH